MLAMDLSPFASLKNLQALRLSFEYRLNRAPMANVVAALCSCPQLRSLKIGEHTELTGEDLATMLQSLPLLNSLHLSWCDGLTSLSALRFTPQLRSIYLEHCSLLDPSELQHVLLLQHLQRLSLCRSFTRPLTAQELLLFQLDSPIRALPDLVAFEYRE